MGKIGIRNIGVPGEGEPYDPARHEITRGKASPGEPVIIEEPGWQIKFKEEFETMEKAKVKVMSKEGVEH